jgi:hypothetical protein
MNRTKPNRCNINKIKLSAKQFGRYWRVTYNGQFERNDRSFDTRGQALAEALRRVCANPAEYAYDYELAGVESEAQGYRRRLPFV